jgi:hypothetical protein
MHKHQPLSQSNVGTDRSVLSRLVAFERRHVKNALLTERGLEFDVFRDKTRKDQGLHVCFIRMFFEFDHRNCKAADIVGLLLYIAGT